MLARSTSLSTAGSSEVASHDPTPAADVPVDVTLAATHEIPAHDIQIGAKIGQGGMGQVFVAKWVGTYVAVKLVRNKDASEQLQAEAIVLSQLRHPCIASFFGTTIVDGCLGVVMEYMSGSLFTLLFNTPKGHNKPDAAIRCRIAQETAAGIAHLHRNDFMHRDIKTSNVLLDEALHAKVSDFGIAKRVHSLETRPATPVLGDHTSNVGTPRYMAPEVRLSTDSYSEP